MGIAASNQYSFLVALLYGFKGMGGGYLKSSPYLFFPLVPQMNPKLYNDQRLPNKGIRLMETHQALLLRSCHRCAWMTIDRIANMPIIIRYAYDK